MQRYTVTNYFEDNRFELRQDGALIYSGAFHDPLPVFLNDPQSIDSYRLNLTDGLLSSGEPLAVIDNITIRAVPEPASAMLAGACLAFLSCRRRR